MIRDLKEGEYIAAQVLLRSVNKRTTSKGSDYLDVEFSDKSGSICGKMWEPASLAIIPRTGDYAEVLGEVGSYNGKLQVTIKNIVVKGENDVDLSLILPSSKYDVEEMWRALQSLMTVVQDDDYRYILYEVFSNAEFVERFKKSSAATSAHHAFVGGLLEHTLGVTKLAIKMGSVVPEVNLDLLVTAAILHDIGKVAEYSAFPANTRTRLGVTVGHVSYGASVVADVGGTGVQHQKLEQLVHCILAHHGKLEWGSPVMPAIIEAEILHFADNLDAKLEMFREAFADPNYTDENGVYARLLETTVFKTV